MHTSNNQLHRISMLVGDAAIEKLRAATVMVVGCGAVGSFAIEALARSGIGHIIVIDFDRVEESNINRQLFATHSTIGQPKVDVARARIHDIAPDATITTINGFFDENIQIDVKPDFVIDAIDTIESKIALYKWCGAHHIPFIASMGAARKRDPSMVRIARISQTFACPLARRVRRRARDENIPDFDVVFSAESPAPHTAPNRQFGSIITVTGTFGLILANYVINKLID